MCFSSGLEPWVVWRWNEIIKEELNDATRNSELAHKDCCWNNIRETEKKNSLLRQSQIPLGRYRDSNTGPQAWLSCSNKMRYWDDGKYININSNVKGEWKQIEIIYLIILHLNSKYIRQFIESQGLPTNFWPHFSLSAHKSAISYKFQVRRAISTSNSSVAIGFLVWDCRYKSVAIWILHDAKFSPIPYIILYT